MSNKRSTPAGVTAARKQRKPAAVAEPSRTDVWGNLPGDETADLYWEQRVAAWLGVARKRVALIRRRALREGEHWVAHVDGIVYTVAGLQKLRDYLGSLGELTPPVAPTVDEPPAPVGPPERRTLIIAKLFANTRLMQARTEDCTPEKPVLVLVRVRDNRNFMPGMRVPVIHDARANIWQVTGRLPRRKGRY